MFNSVKPRARYYGYSSAIAGANPPAELRGVQPGRVRWYGHGLPGFAKPGAGMATPLLPQLRGPGQPTGADPAPNVIQDFCTPLSTVTNLWGKTKGEGKTIP